MIMDDFSEYLSKLDDPAKRTRVEEVLGWVAGTFPALAPRIAWNQPMFTDHGTFIVGFSVAKHHLALSPEEATIRRFSDEIRQAGYEHTRMLIRIPWNRPVDWPLLERLIAFNIRDKADCATFWRKPDGDSPTERGDAP